MQKKIVLPIQDQEHMQKKSLLPNTAHATHAENNNFQLCTQRHSNHSLYYLWSLDQLLMLMQLVVVSCSDCLCIISGSN